MTSIEMLDYLEAWRLKGNCLTRDALEAAMTSAAPFT